MAAVVSDESGGFSLQHFVAYEDKTGNITVIARFFGNKIYTANEAAAVYTIKVGTILERRDGVVEALRGEQVTISGKLFEDWGGQRGIEVQRESVTLLIDEIVVSYKRTAFDGSVTFTAPIEPDKFSYGEVPVEIAFSGTEFYEPSMNTTLIVIRANAILTLAELRVEGEIFDPMTEVLHGGEEVYGRILLQDDNFQPIADGGVKVFYEEEMLRAPKILIVEGVTDSQGYFEFYWNFVIYSAGNKTFTYEYEGLKEDSFLRKDDIVILPTVSPYKITYDLNGGPTDIDTSIIITTGEQRLTPGSSLDLVISLRHPEQWNVPELIIFLIAPPEGMEISSDGKVTWTPDEDQLGMHTIIVAISDGVDSQTSSFEIKVVDEGTEEAGSTFVLIGLFFLSLVIVIVVIILVVISKKASLQGP